MSYQVTFATTRIEKIFHQSLDAIPNKKLREQIMYEIEELAENPKPYPPSPRLKQAVQIFSQCANFRLYVGGKKYRVLYDVNDKERIVYIIALKPRQTNTYKSK